MLTPEGQIARYLFGIEYAPEDLRLALVEASAGQDRHARSTRCCSSATSTTRRPGKYGAAIMRLLRVAGVADGARRSAAFVLHDVAARAQTARAALPGASA